MVCSKTTDIHDTQRMKPNICGLRDNSPLNLLLFIHSNAKEGQERLLMEGWEKFSPQNTAEVKTIESEW